MNGQAPPAAHAFLSWLRRGVSTAITAAGPDAPRAELPITVRFNADALAAEVRLAMYGPGEVTGFDPRAVIRTWPGADVHSAEPNYFPIVEFGEPDLPWRFTPVPADGRGRLRPWLCLIALADGETSAPLEPAGPERPFSVVTVDSAASLPNLDQSWAWAHTQVSGVKAVDGATLADLLANQPQRVISRLLCPRRLEPGTAYTAYVVPSFARGRLAGLGEPVDEALAASVPAWRATDRTLRLPVYHRWRFQTGLAGDFESLVRDMLRGVRILPPTVGIRPMDVDAPGAGLPPASPTPLGLEGALKTTATETTPWDPPARTTFITRLRRLLNQPAELLVSVGGARTVAPPIYGRWHAARDRLIPLGRPRWLDELNTDPRLRAIAGLGTRVVQAQQRALLASAWQQVDAVREANRTMRQAQVSREASARIHDKHLLAEDAEPVVAITAPVHSHVLASPITIKATLAESALLPGVLEPAWRRIFRPLGPIGRRQGRAEAPVESRLLTRLNRGEISPAPPPGPPSGMTTPARAGAGLVPPWLTPALWRLLRALPAWLVALGALLLVAGGVVLLTGAGLGTAVTLFGVGIAALAGSAVARRAVSDLERRMALHRGAFTAEMIGSVPSRPGFVATESPPGAPRTTPAAQARGLGGDSVSAQSFRSAAAALFARVGQSPAPGRSLPSVSLEGLKTRLVEELDPEKTITRAVQSRLRLPEAWAWQPEDPLEPVMAAPEFPQPMYEALRDLSQDWLLPGLDQVPTPTVSLLETNQRFVEAYMVGLNHEMARELLWHEYPTDQRGTYFRQFWEPRGYVPAENEPVDPEAFKDIKLVPDWSAERPLGSHTSRRPPPGANHLALLLRGELLRRYPTAAIYAVKAQPGPGGHHTLSNQELHPVFRGSLRPDVSFFGFELTEAQARGNPESPTDVGWFFVLQEQPSEPRFGLDVGAPFGSTPADWRNLSWEHLAATAEDLPGITYVDLNAGLPETVGLGSPSGFRLAWHADAGPLPHGSRAADLAYMTLQLPVRVAVHAANMLPISGPAPA